MIKLHILTKKERKQESGLFNAIYLRCSKMSVSEKEKLLSSSPIEWVSQVSFKYSTKSWHFKELATAASHTR